MRELLITNIEKLANELELNNNDASAFFLRSIEKLKQEKDEAETLQRLISCGAIVQYANFTSTEEKLFRFKRKICPNPKNS